MNVDEHKSLGGQYNVKGFPTVKVFGADKSKPEDYTGPRTAQGLVDAGFDALRNKVSAQMPGKKSGGSSSSGKKVICFWEFLCPNYSHYYNGNLSYCKHPVCVMKCSWAISCVRCLYETVSRTILVPIIRDLI